MNHHISRRLSALGLALILAVPAGAAGMSAFVPNGPYSGFSDVPAGAWYTADVEQAVKLGLMKGKGNGTFDPQGKLSAAEAITMAVQVHAAYTGQTFTPGGSPWYRNALDYALENGLVLRGEFSDYTAPATRAQMAGLFAYALPTGELERINRVAAVPDVSADTDHAGAIYLLYGAGVLAGTGGGAFQPQATIDRASAAAILNRVALPGSRVTLSLDRAPAGTTAESPDGAFRLTFGVGGWEEISADGAAGLRFQDKSGTLTALSCRKDSRTEKNLEDFAVGRLTALRDELGGLELLEQPGMALFRGLSALTWSYRAEGRLHTVICVENTGFYVTLDLAVQEGEGADEWYEQMLSTAYTLDLAL